MRFFLVAIDPKYGCPVLEALFKVSDLSDLRRILKLQVEDDPEMRMHYSIDTVGLAAITSEFAVSFDPRDREVELWPWHSIRATPYLVHTNYELFLLLDGRKKFARMGESFPPEAHYQEELFEPYVASGILHKVVEVSPYAKPIKLKDGRVFHGDRTVYYTSKGEEWRVAAWKLIFSASKKLGWNETFERLEGMLFGYEEWQMDWWIGQWRRPPKINLQNQEQQP